MNHLEQPTLDSSSVLYVARPFLLSHAELRFFRSLQEAVERDTLIAVKVRLADLVGCIEKIPDKATLGRITQKHVDFVLFDQRHTRILAAIELDDSSHEREQTMKRDAFVNELLNSVGIPLLRVQAAGGYNPMVIRQQIYLTLGRIRSVRPRVRKIRHARRRYRR
jgi:hypothetical protein